MLTCPVKEFMLGSFQMKFCPFKRISLWVGHFVLLKCCLSIIVSVPKCDKTKK